MSHSTSLLLYTLLAVVGLVILVTYCKPGFALTLFTILLPVLLMLAATSHRP